MRPWIYFLLSPFTVLSHFLIILFSSSSISFASSFLHLLPSPTKLIVTSINISTYASLCFLSPPSLHLSGISLRRPISNQQQSHLAKMSRLITPTRRTQLAEKLATFIDSVAHTKDIERLLLKQHWTLARNLRHQSLTFKMYTIQ